MPRAKKEDRGEWLVMQVSLNAIASVLGVAQNTVLEWRDNGAPLLLMPALWVAWAINQNIPTASQKDWHTWCAKLGVSIKEVATEDDERKLPGHCSYDGAVMRPMSYADALQREKVIGEELDNQIRRGKVLTIEQVEIRDNAWNSATATEAEKVQRLVDGLEGVTPEARKLYLDRFREWRKNLNDALAKTLR